MERYENFGFLKECNEELYTKLSGVEDVVKTNPAAAVPLMRKPFEQIVALMLKKNGIKFYKEDELNDRIKKMLSIRWVNNFNNRNKVSYINIYGKERQAKRLDYIRWLLNSSVHEGDKTYWPRIDTVNAMKALRFLHTLAKRLYAVNGTDIEFDESYCPIGSFIIYDSYVPSDSKRSLCKREYRGVEYDSTHTRINKYAIIREYDKSSRDDDVFRLRNEKCFNEASKYSIGPVPDHMADTNAIQTKNGVDSYYICYGFKHEPHSLTNKILEDMDYNAKLSMCKGLCTCLSQLHTSDTPIYHRLLSSESVYVCKIRNTWVAYIIKFDCAKIDAGETAETVISYWEKAKEKRDQTIEIYQPPECKNGITPEIIDWSKVDIYSLGMLMACIFAGDLTHEVKDLRKLKNCGCKTDMLSLLDDMMSDVPEIRPSIDEVMERLA